MTYRNANAAMVLGRSALAHQRDALLPLVPFLTTQRASLELHARNARALVMSWLAKKTKPDPSNAALRAASTRARGDGVMTPQERRVDLVMRWGYYVVEFSPYHFRIQDAVDFWPSTEKWHCARGYKFESKGKGMDSLKAYLSENFPLPT